ncbi:MAG: metallophosphoesterase family protein [Burkholderiaceae bacterium]|nr:metallophosphoesterase family protein [Burkholderiaceae bacterium]
MRLAIVSDIHGNLAALEAVVADIKRRGVDRVVNLGDSLSGPLLPLETAQYLMAQDWIQLAGNHDRQILEINEQSGEDDKYARAQLTGRELAWLATLPPTHYLSSEVLLCHGTPDSDMTPFLRTAERAATRQEIEARLGDTRAQLILCGHTHLPQSVRLAGGPWVVNPGSVGRPAYDDDTPYPHVVETGSPDARYAIIEKAGDRWLSSLLTVPYDHRAMAALASSRGMPNWEIALLTGYMS